MKKILSFLIIFIVTFIPINVYADDASVNIEVVGKVEKGSNIEILVNLKDVEKFYAASVDFTYDTSQLKVESIVASEFITKHSNDIMELGGETDKNGNTASYSFTFLGDSNGISGSGTLVKITANVLNNEKLSINQDNMKIKLVQRVGDTVENYSYSFLGYGVDNTTNGSNDSTSIGNSSNNDSNSNDKTNVDGNKNENSTSSAGSSNNTFISNEDINSNASNDSSSNTEKQENGSNDNADGVLKEDIESDESETININGESDNNDNSNKVLNDNDDENKTKSSSNGRGVIWVAAAVVIFGIIGVGIKYRSKL